MRLEVAKGGEGERASSKLFLFSRAVHSTVVREAGNRIQLDAFKMGSCFFTFLWVCFMREFKWDYNLGLTFSFRSE